MYSSMIAQNWSHNHTDDGGEVGKFVSKSQKYLETTTVLKVDQRVENIDAQSFQLRNRHIDFFSRFVIACIARWLHKIEVIIDNFALKWKIVSVYYNPVSCPSMTEVE